MNNFKRNDKRYKGGADKWSGGRDSGRTEMYKAICDECGRNCEVPFKPSGNKPIFCSSCFESRGGKENKGFRDRNSGGMSFGGRDAKRHSMHKAICAECGRSCEVPFIPTGDKPVYCNSCFDKNKSEYSGKPDGTRVKGYHINNEELMKNFGNLNYKLDKILGILTAAPAQLLVSKKDSAKEDKVSKPKVSKAKKSKLKE